MNAYEKSQELNLDGTDAAKVAILQTLTVSDIPTKSLARLLREESLLLWTGEKYVGSIQTLVASQGANPQFVAGIDELKSAVFGGSAESLLTTVPKWATKVWSIVSAIVALVPDTAGLIDRVYALDGCRPYKDLTVQEFAAQRTAAESIALKTTALELVTTTAAEAAREEYRKADSTPETIVAAAVAVLESV